MYRFALEYLQNWKNENHRKPLIIRGARQVGKSYLVRMFGKASFENIAEVNFEQNRRAAAFFKNCPPEKTIALLEAELSREIRAGKTLLFLDEIQAAPEVLASLRYFHEQTPDLHVIAAGSLLEFILEDHTFSMPVGRIEYLHLGPMTFEEYLIAMDKKQRYEALQGDVLQDTSFRLLHDSCMADFRDFCIVGGMPASIRSFKETGSYLTAAKTQEGILATCRDDFNKYKPRFNCSRLVNVFTRLPLLVGQKLKYTSLDPSEQSRDLSHAMHLLEMARLFYRVLHTHANGPPLGSKINERYFKMLFLDVGLLCAAAGLDMAGIQNAADMTLVNSGAVAEQFIGQHLLYAGPRFKEPQLHCWMRQKHNSSAEVDYIIQLGADIMPIEVKAGKTGRLKSLHVFLKEKNRTAALRFNADPPSRITTALPGEPAREYSLLSLPLYLVGQTARLCRETFNPCNTLAE